MDIVGTDASCSVQLEGVRGQRSTQLWSGELGAGLDDRVPSRMIDSGQHSVMPRASSEILPGYAGGSTFLTEIGLKPANAAAAAKHSRMAHGPGWQDVQIATPHKSLVHTSARELTVPGLSTVIGAYKEISHLVDGASSKHGVMSMRKGEDAAESLERAADSLDSISASMRKDSKPSKAKLARIATSLSGISSTLVGGVHSPWPHAQGSGLASQEMNTLAENVHEHAAQLLGSHFAVLAGNGTENSANRTGDVGPSPMWGSFETNKDGSILL